MWNIVFFAKTCVLQAPWHIFRVLPGAARCARASLHMTRRVVTPKSNCISGGLGLTNAACTMRAFRLFGLDFRCRNEWISKIRSNHSAAICLHLISWKYQFRALRNEKVIPCHATVHASKNSNLFLWKNELFGECETSHFLLRHAFSKHLGIFFAPCRGPLAARERPFTSPAEERKERDVSL